MGDARIGDSDAAISLLSPALRGQPHENLCVVHLGPERRLLHLSRAGGERDRVSVSFRATFAEALAIGAEALILAHNHPSGDPVPSRADLLLTRRLVALARPLRLAVLDHLIFAGERVTSFRGLGLL